MRLLGRLFSIKQNHDNGIKSECRNLLAVELNNNNAVTLIYWAFRCQISFIYIYHGCSDSISGFFFAIFQFYISPFFPIEANDKSFYKTSISSSVYGVFLSLEGFIQSGSLSRSSLLIKAPSQIIKLKLLIPAIATSIDAMAAGFTLTRWFERYTFDDCRFSFEE